MEYRTVISWFYIIVKDLSPFSPALAETRFLHNAHPLKGAVDLLLMPKCPQPPIPISNVYPFNKYLLNSWKKLYWILVIQGCIKINMVPTFKVFSIWWVTQTGNQQSYYSPGAWRKNTERPRGTEYAHVRSAKSSRTHLNEHWEGGSLIAREL